MMRRRLALPVVPAALLVLVALCGCNSGDDGVVPGAFFGGPLLSTITTTVTADGAAIDLGDGHSLVFGANAVLDDTQVRVTRLGGAGTNLYWSMFTPHYEIDILSGGQAGGGVVNLVLDAASLNQANHNMWLTGVYHWTPFTGQVQIATGPDRTAADLARWMPVGYLVEGETTLTQNIEAHLGLVGAAHNAGSGSGSTVIPTGPTFAGIAPTTTCPLSNVPSRWLQQPTAPEGYRYVGYTVVVNKVCEETSFDLARAGGPTDINIIHSSTTVEDQVTTQDIIVAHTFEPIPSVGD